MHSSAHLSFEVDISIFLNQQLSYVDIAIMCGYV